MGRIVERVRGIGPRWAVLVLAVVALATVLVYFGGREAGVGERSEAGTAVAQAQPVEAAQQGDGEGAGEDASEEETGGAEPLVLTLSAPEICEAQHPRGDGIGWAWGAEGTVRVNWTVSGGGGAYTVAIAGEEHTGASGTAEITCALEHGRIRDDAYGRRYVLRNKPFVDSGLKTITATVTDGTGASAEATADVYVILSPEDGEHVLQSGETYRIRGWLVTVPEGVEIDWHRGVMHVVCVRTRADGTVNESINCEHKFHLGWSAPEYDAVLTLGMDTGEEHNRVIWWRQDLEGANADELAVARALEGWADGKLSELAASVGVPPQLDGD